MVRLTIDTVSTYTRCSTHLPCLLSPREEGCLCRQLAARCEYIWRASESGQKTSGLSWAQDSIPGKVHALHNPNRLQQNHHKEPPTPSASAFLPSLNDYPAVTPVHWEKPVQPGAQWRNWGRATHSHQASRLQCSRCPTSPWQSLELSKLSPPPWKDHSKFKPMAERWQQCWTILVVDES